ncbi:Ger(x)C family spore germination protein [Sediminibacillus albus]|uniref:Spore germination protein n=1 Tax=Sediminibacillus albus TaxID=407036 RepID=A0A1G9CBB2_9BACI|nr:Ger(x)C family spore germination protein [Sediminibacillus albus]SDK48704.1 spore germination protein [Sediminibacillus albus]
MPKLHYASLCFIFILLAGCAPAYPIEKLGVINTIGVDINQENEEMLDSTYVFFQFDPNANSPNELVSSTAKTIKGARERANLKSNFRLVPGKLRVQLFGPSIAEQGIFSILDTLSRDAKITDTMYLAAADSSAGDILSQVFQNSTTNVGTHLYQLIDTNVEQEILIRTTLRDFMHKYFDVGSDPVLPLLSVKDQMPSITKMALFQDDRQVGEISTEEGFFIKLLSGKYQTGRIEVDLPIEKFESVRETETDNRKEESLFLALSELRSRNKIKLVSKEEVKFKSEVKIEARLVELSEQLTLDDEKTLHKLEDEIAKNLKQQINNLMAKFKELNVDPIGFGEIYNTKHPITKKEWRAKFPEMKLDIDLKVKILRHGIIE